MALKLGSADVTKVYVGAAEAQKVYLGNVEVYSASVPETELTLTQRNAIDAIVTPLLYPTNTVPGVILSITGPEGYYTKAYGNNEPGLNAGRPLTTADHFRMGSVTKTFTALAFWMAVDQGLVSLTDTLEDFVPGVPGGSSITMAHLLSMRSGVYEYTADWGVLLSILLNPTGDFSEEKALNIIKGKASQATPGTKYAYTNSNAVLIGAVVEAATGRRLRDIFQEDIFTPLGMTETAWPSNANIPAPASSNGQFNPEYAQAAGALTTTIGDFTKWAKAMRDGQLISADSRDTWHSTFISNAATPGTHPPSNLTYGYFLFKYGTWLGHDGSVSNYASACAFDTVSGATITVSTSLATSDAFYKILRNIAAYLYPDSVLDP